jgi:XTP/dITP diphosphohydrolase
MKRLVLASSNAGKLAELQPLLAGAGYELVTQGELGVSDAIEDGHSFVENALIKARHACRGSGLPALADDSGIVVDALDGAPGLLSARYAGVHGDAQSNNRKLLADLQGVPEGEAHGALRRRAGAAAPRRGSAAADRAGRVGGPRARGPARRQRLRLRPAVLRSPARPRRAELEPELKNRVSHRGQALAQLRRLLGC